MIDRLEISHNRSTFGGFAVLYGVLTIFSLFAASHMLVSIFGMAHVAPGGGQLLLNKLLLILYLVTAFLFSALGFYYVNFLLLVDRKPGLVIDGEGIRFCYLGNLLIPWSEIERIEERTVLGYAGVVVTPRDRAAWIARIPRVKRALFQLQRFLRRDYFDIEVGYLKATWPGRLIDEIRRLCPAGVEIPILRVEDGDPVFIRPAVSRIAIAMNMMLAFFLLFVYWREGYLLDFPSGIRFWLLVGILIAPYVNTVALFQAETQPLRLGAERSFWDVKIPALVMNAGLGLIPLPAVLPALIDMAVEFNIAGWDVFVSLYKVGGLSVFAAMIFVVTSLFTLIALLPDSVPRWRSTPRPAKAAVIGGDKPVPAKGGEITTSV